MNARIARRVRPRRRSLVALAVRRDCSCKRSDVYLHDAVLRVPDGDVRPQPDRRLRGPDVARPGGVLRHRRVHRGDRAEGRLAVPRRAADRGGRLLRGRTGARLPGAARAAPLPRVRHARLQRPRLPRDAQRGEDHRRHVRHLQHPAAVAARRSRPTATLAFFYFTLVSLVVLALLLWWLLRSPWGRAFAALRDNPIRAESLGVNITAYTLLAFAIGAACAGIGGVYYASLVEFIEPGPFHFSTSLMMLLAVIVGGSGRFFGPVLGTVIIILLPEAAREQHGGAEVHAEVVPRVLRRRRRRR